jgi:predicted nucleic acid-binding protein
MKPILLDTGCVVALLDRSERHHEQCAEVVGELSGPLVTCEAVIAESCHLLRRCPGAPEAVLENVARGIFQIPFQLLSCAEPVARLMRRYSRVPMDFADACLVHLASELQSGLILTLDRDFTIYRWGRARAFQNLLEP